MAEVSCPFCGFKGPGEYEIKLHIEEHHTEDSPFVPDDGNAFNVNKYALPALDSDDEAMPEETLTKCTRTNCGEYVLLTDIDDHLEVHEAIAAAESEDMIGRISINKPHKRTRTATSASSANDAHRSPQKSRKSRQPESNSGHPSHLISQYFSGISQIGRPPSSRKPIRQPREIGRLGRRELGPYAFEKTMPAHVRRRLVDDSRPRSTNHISKDGRLIREAVVENETSGLINVVANLCAADAKTEATYLCDPAVRHVVKLRCDGNFCGYWNIQMLLSYLGAGRSVRTTTEHAPLPNVLELQDTIEKAWANGICSYGRIETGGIRGTRKWIGTHEALAYFTQVGVSVDASCFRKEDSTQSAVVELLDCIEAYFLSAVDTATKHGTSHVTSLAPIYFQRLGHSMTIVGLERRGDGSRNLIVFDPSFGTAEDMNKLIAGGKSSKATDTLLKPYRRSDVALSRWDEFEIVVPQIGALPSKPEQK